MSVEIGQDKERLKLLEQLVDELVQDKPREDMVKTYMREAGIPYSQDPVDRINRVLKALHFKAEDKDFIE